MTKARTLADFISDGSPLADGTISVSEVSGAAPLASPTFTGTASGTFSGPLTGAVTGNVTGDLTGNVTGNLTGNVTGDVAGDIDLSAIAATISDTAVDVFVYDTSKDSDGGAWRKRTQNTSWYNETLNTATRGSRKEFPAVAVIVAESNQVTIYDGDAPDMPMWMVFDVAGGAAVVNMIGNQSGVGRSVTMFNGQLSVGADGGYTSTALHVVDFIADTGRSYTTSTGYNGDWPSNISTRNTQQTFIANSAYIIAGVQVHDVAMTVLPNAPIDAATGLPVPTIAVATNGGVSVIKDDGTVVDLGATVATDVTFDEYSGDVFVVYNSSGAVGVYGFNVPSSDQSGYTPSNFTFNNQSWSGAYQWPTAKFRDNAGVLVRDNYVNMGTNDGLYKSIDTALANTPSTNFQAKITSTYNTGWMNGDIKLATLSDTDDTDVTGSELVTNGTFDSDTSGWSALNSATLSVVSGALRISQTTVNYGRAEQAISVEIGKTYTLSLELKGGTGAARVILGTTSEGTQYYVGSILTAAQTISATFTATTTTAYLTLTNDTTTDNTYYDFDNVSVRLAEEDRSVNGNGLQVFGTVAKNPVATGADLVAYSGFSASNYLEQPYNSDLDFGTGDFSIMCWVKTNSSAGGEHQTFVSRAGRAFDISKTTLNNYRFYITPATFISTTSVLYDQWVQLVATRRSGLCNIYVNGKEEASGTATTYIGSGYSDDDQLTIGVRVANGLDEGNVSDKSDIALARISATAPSPEQIKKIYEDEKVLFQENAQATLYGSSDAVTALAYDDSTELLHVGTSAGRSDFQGLRRVNNTTNAVGAAISASNGMIVEE